jgi:demethylmenaquinone methyltransferase/2-methoxy-6-polyprenyl-1,4-benzoquinol methylase
MNKEQVAAFFDNMAFGWDVKCKHSVNKINAILNHAGISRGCTVLDIACGTGVLFPFYLERGVSDIVGVDLSTRMIAQAQAKFHDPRITLIVGDAEQVPLDMYDRCVLYSALPHFEDPESLIRSLAVHLKPNGRLTVAHSESKESINQRHECMAGEVSVALKPAFETARLFSPYMDIDVLVDNEEMYVISGLKK